MTVDMVFRSLGQLSRHAHLAKSLWTNSAASQNNPSQSGFFVSTKDLPRLNAQVTARSSNGFGHGSESRNDPHNNTTRTISGAVNTVAFSATVPLSSLDEEKETEINGRRLKQRSRAGSTLVARPAGISSHKSVKSRSVRTRRFSTSVIVYRERDVDTNKVSSTRQTTVEPETIEQRNDKYLEESAVVDEDDVTHIESKSPEQHEREDQIVTEKLGKKLTAHHNARLIDIAKSLKVSSLGLSDVSPLLQEYSAMLTDRISPDLETYTLLLDNLLDAASRRASLQNKLVFNKKLKNRHGGELLPFVNERMSIFDEGRSYLILALNIFAGSNSVQLQKYKPEIYRQLLSNSLIYGEHAKAALIVDILKKRRLLEPEHCIFMVRLAGARGDLSSVTNTYETFKDMTARLESPDRALVLEMYAALIEAYFSCKKEVTAIQFLEKVLTAKEPYSNNELLASKAFGVVLTSVIEGFTKNNDLKEAWAWIKQIEQDRSVCSVPIDAMASFFSKVCISSMSFVDEVFDFVASQSRCASDPSFNDMRCEYLIYSITKDNEQAVYKAIRESHLRGGIWDETTIVRVIKYLSLKGDLNSALDTFRSQSIKLEIYYKKNNLIESSRDLMRDVTLAVADELKETGNLNLKSSLALMNSAFGAPLVISKRVFTNQAAADMLEILLSAHETKEYQEIRTSSRSLPLDIVSLLTEWIQNSSTKTGLSISPLLLEKLRKSYCSHVGDVAKTDINLNNELMESFVSCLNKLGEKETEAHWLEILHNNKQNTNRIKEVQFDLNASQQIISYANTAQGLASAFRLFQNTTTQGDLVTGEAVASLFQASAEQNVSYIFSSVYEIVLQNYQSPTSVQLWDTRVAIYRAVIAYGAAFNFSLAQQAHQRLIDMNSSPDATGYAKLISYSSSTSIHDEASEAKRLFDEARDHGIIPNTFMYNVRLSKLAKARKLPEALELFEEMSQLGVKKTSATYGTMISACCRAGDGQRALAFFDEMERSPHYVVKVVPYNILLQFYVHTKKDRKTALQIYERMRYMGVTPSSHTYKLLIDVYSGIEPIDLTAADNVLLTIQRDHQPISTQHFASLIYARGVLLKDLPAAQKFYADLLVNNRVRPDKVIFQTLLECYVMNNRVADTQQVLKDMIRYNVKLDAYMANVLIRGWASTGMDRSVALFDFILENNSAEPSSYESIIRAFAVHGDFENAYRILSLMKSNDYPAPVVLKVENLVSELREHSGTFTQQAILFDSIFKSDSHMRLDVREKFINDQLVLA